MKAFNKLLIIITIISLLVPSFLIGYADEANLPITETQRDLLLDALRDVEQQKSEWDLENINFNKLHIGYPIQTYNYIANNLEHGQVLYPIIHNNQLILWAYIHNNQFQISDGLVSEVRHAISESTSFALIYDANSAYIYSDGTVTKISDFLYPIESRSQLSLGADLSRFDITTRTLADNVPIGYNNVSRALPVNAVCYITSVPQTMDKTCWAATTATIYNYINNLTGSSALDDIDVAQGFLHNNYNRYLGYSAIDSLLDTYEIPYTGRYAYGVGSFTDDDIYISIYNGFPVFGGFQVVGGAGHAATIYACNMVAGRMSVADPNGGSYTATLNSNGIYSYIFTGNNSTLELEFAFFYPN